MTSLVEVLKTKNEYWISQEAKDDKILLGRYPHMLWMDIEPA